MLKKLNTTARSNTLNDAFNVYTYDMQFNYMRNPKHA